MEGPLHLAPPALRCLGCSGPLGTRVQSRSPLPCSAYEQRVQSRLQVKGEQRGGLPHLGTTFRHAPRPLPAPLNHAASCCWLHQGSVVTVQSSADCALQHSYGAAYRRQQAWEAGQGGEGALHASHTTALHSAAPCAGAGTAPTLPSKGETNPPRSSSGTSRRGCTQTARAAAARRRRRALRQAQRARQARRAQQAQRACPPGTDTPLGLPPAACRAAAQSLRRTTSQAAASQGESESQCNMCRASCQPEQQAAC